MCTLSISEYLKRKFLENILSNGFLRQCPTCKKTERIVQQNKRDFLRANYDALYSEDLLDKYQLKLKPLTQEYIANFQYYEKEGNQERCCSPAIPDQIMNQISLLKAQQYVTSYVKGELLFHERRANQASMLCYDCGRLGYTKGARSAYIKGFIDRLEQCCEPCSDEEYSVIMQRYQAQPRDNIEWATMESYDLERYSCISCDQLGWGYLERGRYINKYMNQKNKAYPESAPDCNDDDKGACSTVPIPVDCNTDQDRMSDTSDTASVVCLPTQSLVGIAKHPKSKCKGKQETPFQVDVKVKKSKKKRL
jgi:hypothetical protein